MSRIPKPNKWWKPKTYTQFLCPCCKAQRRMNIDPHFGKMQHILQLLVTTIVVTLCGWPWFQWRTALLFFIFWAIYEVIYRLRLRSKLECPYCGFDPVTFLGDKEKAIAQVKQKVSGS
jgi:hypothetical protein